MTEHRDRGRDARDWAGRWLPAAAAAVLLLGLVALGGRQLPGGGPARPPVVVDFDLQQALTNVFLTGGAIGAVLALVGLFWPGREPIPVPRRSLARYVIGPLIIIGAVGLVFLFPRSEGEPPVQAPAPRTVVDAPAPGPVGEAPVWGLYVLAGALGLALAVMAGRARAESRSTEQPAPEPPLDAGAGALVGLPEDYVPGGDARSRVIGSYVELMSAFASRRLRRAASETAREFVGRAVGPVPAAGPAALRLTELFELARFSQHPVTDADADESHRAVSAVRAALGAAR